MAQIAETKHRLAHEVGLTNPVYPNLRNFVDEMAGYLGSERTDAVVAATIADLPNFARELGKVSPQRAIAGARETISVLRQTVAPEALDFLDQLESHLSTPEFAERYTAIVSAMQADVETKQNNKSAKKDGWSAVGEMVTPEGVALPGMEAANRLIAMMHSAPHGGSHHGGEDEGMLVRKMRELTSAVRKDPTRYVLAGSLLALAAATFDMSVTYLSNGVSALNPEWGPKAAWTIQLFEMLAVAAVVRGIKVPKSISGYVELVGSGLLSLAILGGDISATFYGLGGTDHLAVGIPAGVTLVIRGALAALAAFGPELAILKAANMLKPSEDKHHGEDRPVVFRPAARPASVRPAMPVQPYTRPEPTYHPAGDGAVSHHIRPPGAQRK